MKGDHRTQGRAKLVPGGGVFVVQTGRVFLPPGGNFPDRQSFVESKPQQLDATLGRRAGSAGRGGLSFRGFAE
jgi:hypothetical protein